MNELWANFLGYLSLYRSYIIPVFVLGIFLTAIVWVLMKKRSTKYTENPFRTLFCSCVLSLSVAVIIIMTLYGRTQGTEFAFRLRLFGSYIVSAKYCYVTRKLCLHQNDRCKRFTLF